MAASSAAALRSLIGGPDVVVAPGAPDVLTARLVQAAGFPAVYLTGFGATASRLGAPDIGLLSQTEMTEHARAMTRAVQLPVIADADTGYGGPSNLERTVREHVQAGVAAIHLEDQLAPKRCGQLAGIRLVEADESVRRLRCALAARGGDDLLVIGRTDALPVLGVDEAVRRARLYADAGVDLVFVDGLKLVGDLEAVAAAIEAPKVVSVVDGTEIAALPVADLQDLGFDVVLYPLSTLFAATRAIADTLEHLRRAEGPDGGPARVDYAAFTEIIGLPHHQDLDRTYGE